MNRNYSLLVIVVLFNFYISSSHGSILPAPGIQNQEHGTLSLNESEVTVYLNTVFKTLNLTPDDILSLRNLQVGLYRNQITHLSDIPSEKQAVMDLLRGIPLDRVSLILLEEGLSVKLPEMDTALLTGYGYNFQTDTILTRSPFNMSAKKLASNGFIIPSIYSLEIVNEMHEVFEMYKSSEQYYQSRFSFKESSSSTTEFVRICFWFWCYVWETKTHAGYNSEKKSSSSLTNSSVEEISTSQEQRLFELRLSPDEIVLSDHFVDKVKQLTKFDSSSCEIQSIWKSFFDNYGTHIVSSAFGGGSLDISLRGNQIYKLLAESVETEGKQTTIMNYFHASSSEQVKTGSNSSVYMSDIYKSISFRAGDSRFQKTDFFNIETQEEKSKIIEDWKNSIPQNPIMLDGNLELTSIMDYVELVDPAYRDSLNFQVAINHWLSGSLHNCEWYKRKSRPVSIWFDGKEPGYPWNYPVHVLTLTGAIAGPPIPISQLNSTVNFLCSEEERCTVVNAMAPCGDAAACANKWYHILYESEAVSKK